MKPRLIQSRGGEILLLGPGAGGVKETGNYLIYILFVYSVCGDLPCCEGFSLAAGEGALLFKAVRGLVIAVASCVAEPWL